MSMQRFALNMELSNRKNKVLAKYERNRIAKNSSEVKFYKKFSRTDVCAFYKLVTIDRFCLLK